MRFIIVNSVIQREVRRRIGEYRKKERKVEKKGE